MILKDEYSFSKNRITDLNSQMNSKYNYLKIKEFIGQEIKITKKKLGYIGLIGVLVNGYIYYQDQKEQSQMNENIKIIIKKVNSIENQK